MVSKLFGHMAKTGRGFSCNGEQGMSLIEVLIALAIMSAVAVVFLLGLTTSSRAVMSSQERVVVDSLAKSQMESIKSQTPYIKVADYNPSDPNKRYTLITVPTDLVAQGYAVTVDDPEDVINPPVTGSDNLQKITVHITRNGDPAHTFTVVGYKVNR